MFEIKIHNKVIFTCAVLDEDKRRIGQYIHDNPEKFQYSSDQEAIIQAIKDLHINLYKNYVESNFYAANVMWP